MSEGSVRTNLRQKIVCPHCWYEFSPDETLWVAEHPDLEDDVQLVDQPQRFLPNRFDPVGRAIDAGNVSCEDLACPQCHLIVPRALFEIIPFFASIVGTVSCGKTYFLTAMTWKLRRLLPQRFELLFADTDLNSNKKLKEYERLLFYNPESDQPIKLRKTEINPMGAPDLYNQVKIDNRPVTFPRPFFFVIRPQDSHPNSHSVARHARAICLYDNAGEHFEPGADSQRTPVTRHLARSRVVFMLFDPTQDPNMRAACSPDATDPQIVHGPVTLRQDLVLHEVVDRIRRDTGLGLSERHNRPLIVVLTKFDAWCHLLKVKELREPYKQAKSGLFVLDLAYIEKVSEAIKKLLWKYCPDFVASAQGFAENVTYIPVSATGCAPGYDPLTEEVLGMRPSDINPMWVEVPLLYTLARFEGNLIGYARPGN